MSSAKWRPFCLSLNVLFVMVNTLTPGDAIRYYKTWSILVKVMDLPDGTMPLMTLAYISGQAAI